MTITIKQASQQLDQLVSPALAESWDNVGLIVSEPQNELTGILIALDITPGVLQEALDLGCNLILTHHPIWFRERKTLISDDFASKQIQFAIKNNISLYAFHTNLDSINTGVNRQIVDRLLLKDTQFLETKSDSKNKTHGLVGSGMVGSLEKSMTKNDFLEYVKSVFGIKCIKYSSGPKTIAKVAVCGGSGSFLINAALIANADVLLTGDITYHSYFEPMEQMMLMDIGHYESEQFSVHTIHSIIKNRFNDTKISISSINTNPVRYYY